LQHSAAYFSMPTNVKMKIHFFLAPLQPDAAICSTAAARCSVFKTCRYQQ
jgi:hypothetical protein